MEKLTNEMALIKSKKVWGNFYDYSEFLYTNARTNIKLICPLHGYFEQKFHTHLKSGCYECGKEKRRNSNADIIEKLKKIHNDRYDYSKCKYTTNRNKIIVICKNHGE